MTETKYTFCRICEAACGLIIEVEGNRIRSIKPNRDHVGSRGFACIKGLRFDEIVHSQDRIRAPLKRIDGSLEPISWEQALKEIGTKLRKLIDIHGPDSIGMYVGNGAGFSLLHTFFGQGFAKAVRTKNVFSSATQDCSNKFAVAEKMYGFPLLQPVPDFEQSSCLIILGANPAVSKFSFNGIPNVLPRLKAAEKRGCRIVSVNPRKTETVHSLGEHLPIRPDTDLFFLLAFAHRLINSGPDRIDRERIARNMKNFEQFEALTAPWTPERAARVTGIPAEKIIELADYFGNAESGSIYSSTGINQSSNGTLTFWVQEVINAVTGNLDRQGGTLVGEGIIDFPKLATGSGSMGSTARSRIGDLPAVMEGLPGAILPEEVLTPGEGQVRALITSAGNPALSIPNAARMEKALETLELLVCIDILPSRTTDFAHYVLPGITPLEHPDINYIFQSMAGICGIHQLSYTDTVIEPGPDQKEETWIFTELARAAGLSLFGSRFLGFLIEVDRSLSKIPLLGPRLAMKSEKLLGLILRASRITTLKRIRKQPNGIPLPPSKPDSFLGKRVMTEDGLVDLAPTEFVERAQVTIEERYAYELENADRFKLVNKRETVTHNSYFHNAPSCVKGEKNTNYVYLNPDDADQLGVREGDWVRLSTDVGKAVLPVRITSEMMSRTAAVPWGWGHQNARGLSVASKTGGANINSVTRSGPESVDPLSGMAHLTGLVVEIEKEE